MSKKKQGITVHDLAKELNLNASTVSRALNDHPRISEKTKKKVLKLARAYNYKLNKAAYRLRTGKSRTIGVVVPRINRFFFSNAIHGIEEIAAAEDFNVIICQTLDATGKEKKSIDALLSDKVDGIIASITPDTTSGRPYEKCCRNYEEVLKLQVPLVFFNMACENFPVSKVIVNDEEGGYMATQHLIEKGAKNVAILAGQSYLNIYKRRLEGYKRALADHQIPVDKNLILSGDLTEEVGFKAAEKLMLLPNPPEAIFAVTDYLAIGAIRYLKSINFDVPDQIAVCGFMNEPFNDLLQPSLTSVDQYSHQMGQRAAELLLDHIKYPNKNRTPQTIMLSPQLIVRQSTSFREDLSLTPK